MKKFGYPLETHTVTTKDGYILTVHRIPHGKAGHENSRFKKRPPVLLQHGLMSCSIDWVLRANISLGLMLADAGWDVWLGNNRGTTLSKKHTKLNPDKDKEFWDYR